MTEKYVALLSAESDVIERISNHSLRTICAYKIVSTASLPRIPQHQKPTTNSNNYHARPRQTLQAFLLILEVL